MNDPVVVQFNCPNLTDPAHGDPADDKLLKNLSENVLNPALWRQAQRYLGPMAKPPEAIR